MLTKETKQAVVAAHKKHDTDTASPEVQIALLTKDIEALSEHLKTHKKDIHSRRGLLQKVSRRRQLLKYLKHNDPERHATLEAKLKAE